jgi:hypothetical protein
MFGEEPVQLSGKVKEADVMKWKGTAMDRASITNAANVTISTNTTTNQHSHSAHWDNMWPILCHCLVADFCVCLVADFCSEPPCGRFLRTLRADFGGALRVIPCHGIGGARRRNGV